jgi:hypothetical protein
MFSFPLGGWASTRLGTNVKAIAAAAAPPMKSRRDIVLFACFVIF